MVVSPTTLADSATLRVEFDVTNTGDREGAEVAQVYVKPPRGPKQVLRAFRRVTLASRGKARVAIDLAIRDLAHYDAQSKREVVDPGRYELLVGASSADIREKATFDVAR